MNVKDCVVLYIEDDEEVTIGLRDYFESTEFNVEFIHRYDDLRKALKRIKPCLVIVDDDLNGRSRYDEISNEIKQKLMPSGKPVAFIGCTSENVDLSHMKQQYKKEGYSDFISNTGTEKDLNILEKIMKNLILNM